MKAASLLVLSAVLALPGCVKTEAPPVEVKAAENVPPKEKNIMRFKDKPKPPAATFAGER